MHRHIVAARAVWVAGVAERDDLVGQWRALVTIDAWELLAQVLRQLPLTLPDMDIAKLVASSTYPTGLSRAFDEALRQVMRRVAHQHDCLDCAKVSSVAVNLSRVAAWQLTPIQVLLC